MSLKGSAGRGFRPTTQLAKGSIFDSLYGEVQGSVLLDLFSGSGGLAIEALSRGARRAVMVEKDSGALKAIRDNLDKCGFEDEEALVVRSDAVKFLRDAFEKGLEYDIIVADPPYGRGLAEEVLRIISAEEKRLCRIFIVETDREIEEIPGSSMERYKVKNFGRTRLSYFRYREMPQGRRDEQ